jgi:class 3 adenylate cyclase/pimeloyl-ACP methyl ester carboxylesterase
MERRLAAILAADVAGYSRMMSDNEAATLAALHRQRAQVVAPAIARHHGRIVKLMGDGVLAEFPSIVEAVACAVEVQREMAALRVGSVEDPQIEFRIGVHLGDVMVDGDDLYGDGVNVAARLEAVAEVGGVCISGQAHDEVETKLELTYRWLGPQALKNIPRPVIAYAVEIASTAAATPGLSSTKQEIRYCRTTDGVRLAYAVVGKGPNLVRAGSWFTHLEYDWDNHPAMSGLMRDLARDFRLLRYDPRGSGMSDWEVDEISLDAWVRDLETVVDLARYDRFALYGGSQGGAVSIAYAARHPDRVSHLILYGAFALGWRKRPGANIEQQEAMMILMRHGWGGQDSTFRQLFTTQFMPSASQDQWEALNELQRRSASPEGAVRYYNAVGEVDVVSLLSQVKAPTLVMHVREDGRVPFELGRQIAVGIAGAHFVALPGRNHILQTGEPAAVRFLEEMRLFLAS